MYLLVSNLFDFIMCTSGNHYCLAKCQEFPLTFISSSATSCYLSLFCVCVLKTINRCCQKLLNRKGKREWEKKSWFKTKKIRYEMLIMVLKRSLWQKFETKFQEMSDILRVDHHCNTLILKPEPSIHYVSVHAYSHSPFSHVVYWP